MSADLSTDILVVDSLQGLHGLAPVAAPEPVTIQPPWTQNLVIDRLATWSRDFVQAQSDATLRAVRADWGQYMAWCEGTRRSPLPASIEQLAEFLLNAIARGRKLSTVRRYLFTISLVHEAAELPNPAKHKAWKLKWKAILKKLREKAEKGKDSGLAQQLTSEQAGELLRKDVNQIVASLGHTPVELRDAAMLLLASDALLRESELVRVRVEDITAHRNSSTDITTWSLSVPFSKANRDGKPDDRFVSQETMARLDAWMGVAGITSGYLFLGFRGRPCKRTKPSSSGGRELARVASLPTRKPIRPAEVARIFRRRALAAGLPHALTISGHSARIGMANDLINAGKTTAQIQKAGGWNSAEMVDLYTRKSQAGQNAVAEFLAEQRELPAVARDLPSQDTDDR